MLARGREAALEWVAASEPAAGERECGDLHVVAGFQGGVLLAAIDGLGHGEEARRAAEAAAATLAERPGDGAEAQLRRCHEALRHTRGAAVSVLSLSWPGTLEWAGVGNVEAALKTAAGVEHLLLAGGVVGQRLPRFRARSVSLQPGDLLVMVTDGIRPDFASRLDVLRSLEDTATGLLAARSNEDDALVVAARAGGGP